MQFPSFPLSASSKIQMTSISFSSQLKKEQSLGRDSSVECIVTSCRLLFICFKGFEIRMLRRFMDKLPAFQSVWDAVLLSRQEKNALWGGAGQSSGWDRVRSAGPPSFWKPHPRMWRQWRIRAPAVRQTDRILLVCGPEWGGGPGDSFSSRQHPHVWVTGGSLWRGRVIKIGPKQTGPCQTGIHDDGGPPDVRPTPRPDVDPLPPGTHLLFAQSGRIEHVPLESYEMRKEGAKAVLHLPVGSLRSRFSLGNICETLLHLLRLTFQPLHLLTRTLAAPICLSAGLRLALYCRHMVSLRP